MELATPGPSDSSWLSKDKRQLQEAESDGKGYGIGGKKCIFPPEGVSVYLLKRDACLYRPKTMFLAERFVCAVGLGRVELALKDSVCLCSSSLSAPSHVPLGKAPPEKGKNQNLLGTHLCRPGTIRHCHVVMSLHLQSNFPRGTIWPSFCS